MSERPSRTGIRKAEHLRINLQADVESSVTTGFEKWRFVPRAMPELNLADVRLASELCGRALSAPIVVSCMTGGTPQAGTVNHTLAAVAQSAGLALGLGSGRVLLEEPGALASFDVRDQAPDVPLLANLGAVQLNRGVTTDDCARMVALLRADALVLHLNALQEALQPDGDVVFAGLLAAIETVCRELDVPVIVKEVGWGIPPDDVRRLVDAGVHAVDLAGAGGTSWSEVERHRAEPGVAAVAAAFQGWGLPTAEAVRRARAEVPSARIIASGGVRDGMDAAKAIALGADLVGIAGPFLRAAAEGEEHARAFAAQVVEVLRLAMFCTGCASLQELRGSPRLELADRA
ncbi:MAG TPA: type 2 isopentenyl-diphosphate Delta-isomerase [Candidatus Dormibacteraeota bacterium]|jgi:isopentenyl-diphosphate delta-isomerase